MANFGVTTNWALRKLLGSSNANDIDAGFAALADDVDAKLTPSDQGALASRPVSTGGSPGKIGRTYKATDTGQLFRDNGTGWDEIPLVPISAADIEAQQAWQTLSLSPAGWTGTPDGLARYYKNTLGVVRFSAYELFVPSLISAGTTLATLPAGYRPGAASLFDLIPNSSGSTANTYPIRISTGGVITVGARQLDNSFGGAYSFGMVSFRAEN